MFVHCRLQLTGPELEGPLPDIQPGALPQLRDLQIMYDRLQVSLPASWGSSPAVLPALQELRVQLQFPVQLPAEWAGGFQVLKSLSIYRPLPKDSPVAGWSKDNYRAKAAQHPQTAPPPPPTGNELLPSLPEEWAAGFPQLQLLVLSNIGLTGSIPQRWLHGSFPALTTL